MKYLSPALLFTVFFGFSGIIKAQQPIDQIVAIVNTNIILKSDVDADVTAYLRQAQNMGQPIPFSETLWYEFLNASIENMLLIEKARIDSIVVPDDRVNRQMDQRVNQLIQQAGSERALEEAFGKSILQLKEDFREDFRKQMLTETVRINKFQAVQITRPEVQEFFDSIPIDSLPIIPEQVALSQIVILPPPLKDAKQAVYDFATSLRDSIINHGKSLDELARRHGQDNTARRGGLLPLMGLNELVSEYSAAASALQPGEISEVVETDFGFHIIELIRRIGDKIETRHILLKIDTEQLDDSYAKNRLIEIKDSLETVSELDFSLMAKVRSEDPVTKVSSGKILDPQTAERLIPLNRLDPSLYRVVLLMDEVGSISEPKPFSLITGGKAYRIVRLDQRIPEHVANMKKDYERLKSIALQRKQLQEFTRWINELKSEVYIEYRIPMPSSENE